MGTLIKTDFKYRLHRLQMWVIVILLSVFLWAMPARAEENININLRIEAPSQTILNQQTSVPYSCEVTDSASTTSTHEGYMAICVLQAAKEQGLLTYQTTNWGFAFALDAINDTSNATDWSETWLVYNENTDPGKGIDGFAVQENDNLLFTFGPWPMEPLELTLSTSTFELEKTATLSAKYWHNGNLTAYQDEVNFFINNIVYNSTSGTLEYTPDTVGQKEIYVEAASKTRSEKQTINVIQTTTPEPTINTYHINVNYLNEEIFNQDVSPTSTWFFDSAGTFYSTSTVSALGVLAEASRHGDFPLTIQSGWGSYYVSDIAGHTARGFDGWIYNINQKDPGIGMNDYPIKDGELLTVFYSVWPWKMESNTSSIYLGENVTFKALNYASSTWQTSPSTTISINNQLFITDDGGQYIYTPSATGTLSAFIYGSESWPQNSPTVGVMVLSTSTLPTDETPPPPDNGGGGGEGGGNYTPTYSNIDIEKAVQYLTTKQWDGNFSSALYTDWAAIAFGAHNRSNPTSVAIKNYLLTDPSPTAGFNSVSDCARRAMALMALEINPYQTKTNYIKKITDTFNGTELIDKPENQGLFNDDIFALIPLYKAGYSEQDEIIKQIIAFILSKKTNNNWGSVDLTAAAIQALKPFSSDSLVSKAIVDATLYLKNEQQTDGGFANSSFSTSWAIQAGDAIGESNLDWIKKAKDYLSKKQQTDGSIDNDVWATTQAIPAALDKPWNDILASFSKPAIEQQPTGGTAQNTTTTPTTTPTSTIFVTTTIDSFATSTLDIILDLEITTTTIQTPDTDNQTLTSTETDLNTTTTYKIEKENVTQSFSFDNEETKVPQITKKPNLDNNIAIEHYNNDVTPTTSTNKTELTSQTLSSISTTTIPYSKTAKGVFAGATSLTGALGLYLAWRFIQTLI